MRNGRPLLALLFCGLVLVVVGCSGGNRGTGIDGDNEADDLSDDGGDGNTVEDVASDDEECSADLLNDPNNCGACGHVCPHRPHTEARCRVAECVYQCLPGSEDCNQDILDGCEAQLAVDPVHCGSCHLVCEGGFPNMDPACVDKDCVFRCVARYADCNHDILDGCESNLESDPNNCGYCGTSCENGCSDAVCEGYIPSSCEFISSGDIGPPLVASADGSATTIVVGVAESDYRAARIVEGTAPDGDGFAVATADTYGGATTAAFFQGKFLIGWGDEATTPHTLHLRRVLVSGVVDGAAIFLAESTGSWPAIRIASNRDQAISVWTSGMGSGGGYLVSLAPDGAPSGPPVTLEGVGYEYDVAARSDGFLVTWIQHQPESIADQLRGRWIGTDGTVGQDFQIHNNEFGFGNSRPVAACNDSGCAVVLDSIAFPVQPSEPPGPQIVLVSPFYGNRAKVAASDTIFLAVYEGILGSREGDEDILGVRFDLSGAVLDGTALAITSEPADQTDPVVVFDGTDFVVVWSDSRPGRNLSYALVSLDGSVSYPCL